MNRASDNSREKSQISRDFWRQIRRENGRFHGNFWGKFRRKTKKKAKKKDSRTKICIGRMSNSGQEKKHKSSSNTVLKAIVLVSSYKKNISFTETPGQLTSIFSCNLEPNTATQ